MNIKLIRWNSNSAPCTSEWYIPCARSKIKPTNRKLNCCLNVLINPGNTEMYYAIRQFFLFKRKITTVFYLQLHMPWYYVIVPHVIIIFSNLQKHVLLSNEIDGHCRASAQLLALKTTAKSGMTWSNCTVSSITIINRLRASKEEERIFH